MAVEDDRRRPLQQREGTASAAAALAIAEQGASYPGAESAADLKLQMPNAVRLGLRTLGRAIRCPGHPLQCAGDCRWGRPGRAACRRWVVPLVQIAAATGPATFLVCPHSAADRACISDAHSLSSRAHSTAARPSAACCASPVCLLDQVTHSSR